MNSEILISVDKNYIKIAHVNDGILSDLRVISIYDQEEEGRDIFLACVERVVPHLCASFLDIGDMRSAFLTVHEARCLASDPKSKREITDCVDEGDTVLVQRTHPARDGKGAKVTANISLSGRHVVFVPYASDISVSRAIQDEKERQRLIGLADNIRRDLDIAMINDGQAGWIIRTAAAHIHADDLKKDMGMVADIWHEILDKSAKCEAPCLLYRDIGGVERSLCDMVNKTTRAIVIDRDDIFDKALRYCKVFMPSAVVLLQHSRSDEDLFDRYDLHGVIHHALLSRVDLPSGGWIMIEATEAMTTIDVNSGCHNAPSVAVNLEAVALIRQQIPLRVIGGLIAIDFIDMDREDDKNAVYFALREAFSSDKIPTRMSDFSEFGVIEMTRKRVGHPLKQMLCADE